MKVLRIRFAGHDAEFTHKFGLSALASDVIKVALASRLAHHGSKTSSKWTAAYVDSDGESKELPSTKVLGDLPDDSVVTITKKSHDGGGSTPGEHHAARSPSSHVAPHVGGKF